MLWVTFPGHRGHTQGQWGEAEATLHKEAEAKMKGGRRESLGGTEVRFWPLCLLLQQLPPLSPRPGHSSPFRRPQQPLLWGVSL